MKCLPWVGLALSCAAAMSVLHAEPVSTLTYVDLVHRLTDLEFLATLPAAGEKTAQFSSYDRASRYD